MNPVYTEGSNFAPAIGTPSTKSQLFSAAFTRQKQLFDDQAFGKDPELVRTAHRDLGTEREYHRITGRSFETLYDVTPNTGIRVHSLETAYRRMREQAKDYPELSELRTYEQLEEMAFGEVADRIEMDFREAMLMSGSKYAGAIVASAAMASAITRPTTMITLGVGVPAPLALGMKTAPLLLSETLIQMALEVPQQYMTRDLRAKQGEEYSPKEFWGNVAGAGVGGLLAGGLLKGLQHAPSLATRLSSRNSDVIDTAMAQVDEVFDAAHTPVPPDPKVTVKVGDPPGPRAPAKPRVTYRPIPKTVDELAGMSAKEMTLKYGREEMLEIMRARDPQLMRMLSKKQDPLELLADGLRDYKKVLDGSITKEELLSRETFRPYGLKKSHSKAKMLEEIKPRAQLLMDQMQEAIDKFQGRDGRIGLVNQVLQTRAFDAFSDAVRGKGSLDDAVELIHKSAPEVYESVPNPKWFEWAEAKKAPSRLEIEDYLRTRGIEFPGTLAADIGGKVDAMRRARVKTKAGGTTPLATVRREVPFEPDPAVPEVTRLTAEGIEEQMQSFADSMATIPDDSMVMGMKGDVVTKKELMKQFRESLQMDNARIGCTL